MSRWSLLAALVPLCALAEPLATAPTDAERRESVKKLSKAELEAVMKDTAPRVLVDAGLNAVAAFGGPYRYRMVKRERVRGTLQPASEIDTSVREAPFAVRLHYVGGEAAGRKVVFNGKVNKDQLRVREAGVLSVLGGLWIDAEGSLARTDSNHSIREAGMSGLLTRLKGAYVLADTLGGITVDHEGWDAQGSYCMFYALPNGGKGFEHAKTRICTDLSAGLPTKVEGFDAKGQLIERYEFSKFEKLTTTDEFFDPQKARL